MNVTVLSSHGSPNGDQFISQITQRVESDLSRLGRRIKKVDVLVIDVGDEHKGCVMEAQFSDSDPITVRAHAGTFERAVDKGANKIERLIESRLNHREWIDFPNRDDDLRDPLQGEDDFDDEEPRAI
jgi:hypothetical protein